MLGTWDHSGCRHTKLWAPRRKGRRVLYRIKFLCIVSCDELSIFVVMLNSDLIATNCCHCLQESKSVIFNDIMLQQGFFSDSKGFTTSDTVREHWYTNFSRLLKLQSHQKYHRHISVFCFRWWTQLFHKISDEAIRQEHTSPINRFVESRILIPFFDFVNISHKSLCGEDFNILHKSSCLKEI